MTDTQKLIRENILLLEEGMGILNLLSDGEYVAGQPGTSAVGAHFRHIVNHYDALISGGAIIDYDTRDRLDPVRSSRMAAMARLRELSDALGAHQWPAALTIERMVTSPVGRLETVRVETTAVRELDFLVSHTTHHYAVIALLLRSLNIAIPAAFGMSRSTLHHVAGESIPG